MTVNAIGDSLCATRPQAGALSPRLSYIICTAPRTGSTLLSEALTNTRVAGAPNEFFDIYDHNERFWTKTLGVQSDADYVDRVVASSSTPNGVFGLKLLWHQSPALIGKLRAGLADRAPEASETVHGLFTAKIGEPKYIWLRRQNKLAQAISYYRASNTGLWRSHDRPSVHSRVPDQELAYDFDQIERFLQAVNRFDESWETYFRYHRVKVLMIWYESFVQAYEPTIRSVFDFLGLPGPDAGLSRPRLRQQRDSRSDDWEAAFREEAKARQARFARANGETVRLVEGAVSPKAETKPAVPAASPAAEHERTPLPFTAYALVPNAPAIAKASPKRAWMDASPKRFAYRCLPMVMANQAGWLLTNREKFALTWNGGVETSAIKLQFFGGAEPRGVVSLFGCGIVTFLISCIFGTPPGYNLYVHGPANSPKDGIAPLEGIVETDWAESTFTMNWMVTRPNHPLVFEKDEPIAMITPVRRHELERFAPEMRELSHDSELESLHREWAQSRQRHNADLKIPNSQAQKDGWQRHYMRGTTIRQEPAPIHQTGMLLKDFKDLRR